MLKEISLLISARNFDKMSEIKNYQIRVKSLDKNLEENSEDVLVRSNYSSTTYLAQRMIIDMKTWLLINKKFQNSGLKVNIF